MAKEHVSMEGVGIPQGVLLSTQPAVSLSPLWKYWCI
jgi:hypothetical protein